MSALDKIPMPAHRLVAPSAPSPAIDSSLREAVTPSLPGRVWIQLASSLPAGLSRDTAVVLPVLGAIWAVVRHVRPVDEYVRRVTLEHLGIAAPVTVGWTMP